MTIQDTREIRDTQDMDERDQYLPEDFDELWLEPAALPEEAEQLLTLAETPSEWPLREHGIQQGDELPLPEATARQESEAEAAVEEWTAGMIRPPSDVAARELEEEPIEPVTQLALKPPDEAEREAKYGI